MDLALYAQAGDGERGGEVNSIGMRIVTDHMQHSSVIGRWEFLAEIIDREISAAVREEAKLRRQAAAETARKMYDQLQQIGVSYIRGGDTLESGEFRNDALAGLQPGDVAALVELVRRYYEGHDIRAKVDDILGKAECDCAKCETARTLIERLPK
mgnify:CR=1 FL=1